MMKLANTYGVNVLTEEKKRTMECLNESLKGLKEFTENITVVDATKNNVGIVGENRSLKMRKTFLSQEEHGYSAKVATRGLYRDSNNILEVTIDLNVFTANALSIKSASYNVINQGISPIANKFNNAKTTEKYEGQTVKSGIRNDKDDSISFQFRTLGRDTEKKITNHYTDSVISLRISNEVKKTCNKKKVDFRKVIANIMSNGIVIKLGKHAGEVIDIRLGDGSKLEESEQLFLPLLYTPSGEKRSKILMTSIDQAVAWQMVEEVGGQSISAKLKANNGEIKMKDYKKLTARYGLFVSPALKCAKVANEKFGLLVINKKIVGSHDFTDIALDFLKERGMDSDNETFDGQAFISQEISYEILRNCGIHGLTLEQANRFAFQLRCNQFYAKVFAESFSGTVMEQFVNNILEWIEPLQEKLKAEWIAKGNDAKEFTPIYRVYGNKDNIGMVLDSNAAKIIQLDRDAHDIDVYMLDVAKASVSKGSTQVFSKFFEMDEEATLKFAVSMMNKNFTEFANKPMEDETSIWSSNLNVWKRLFHDAGVAYSLSEEGVEPKLLKVFRDGGIQAKAVKDIAKYVKSIICKASLRIDSMFHRVLFDNSYILTGFKYNILGADERGALECYSPDVEIAKFAEIEAIKANEELTDEEKRIAIRNVMTAAVVKYPSSGKEEIELIVYLTMEQIVERINALLSANKIDEQTRDVLVAYFKETSYGVVKFGCDNTIKRKLAGFDTDYDGVVSIFERGLVEILERKCATRLVSFNKNFKANVTNYAGPVAFIITDKHERRKTDIVKLNPVNTLKLDEEHSEIIDFNRLDEQDDNSEETMTLDF